MDHKLQVIQSNLYKTTLYIPVTLDIMVTRQLPKIFSGLKFSTKLPRISCHPVSRLCSNGARSPEATNI